MNRNSKLRLNVQRKLFVNEDEDEENSNLSWFPSRHLIPEIDSMDGL